MSPVSGDVIRWIRPFERVSPGYLQKMATITAVRTAGGAADVMRPCGTSNRACLEDSLMSYEEFIES